MIQIKHPKKYKEVNVFVVRSKSKKVIVLVLRVVWKL
jgi:hypothetical protein